MLGLAVGVLPLSSEGQMTKCRHVPACYEGPGTDRVLPPKPLGRMARRLQEIAAMPVQARPIDLYAALAEGAR